MELSNKVVKMEDGYFDKVDLYGTIGAELNYRQIFNKLTEGVKFNKGTIDGSYFKNELYLLSEDTGTYFASAYRMVLCDIEKIEKIEESVAYWDNDGLHDDSRIYYEYKTSNLKTVKEEDFKEMMLKYFNIPEEKTLKEIRKYIDWDDRATYFEVTATKDKFYLYVKFNNEYITLELEREALLKDYLWTSAEFLKTITVDKDNYRYELSHKDSLSKAFKKFENDIVLKGMELKVTKLENGFVYNNKFYETIDEILDVVEKIEKEKREYE